MSTAFQLDAFQNNAFQVDIVVVDVQDPRYPRLYKVANLSVVADERGRVVRAVEKPRTIVKTPTASIRRIKLIPKTRK